MSVGGLFCRYISQSDPKGWVPAAALKAISSQIPLCVATVCKYLKDHGPPAFPYKAAGLQQKLTFDHTTSELNYVYKNEPTQWVPATALYVSSKRYPEGVEVTVTPSNGVDLSWDATNVCDYLSLSLCPFSS